MYAGFIVAVVRVKKSGNMVLTSKNQKVGCQPTPWFI